MPKAIETTAIVLDRLVAGDIDGLLRIAPQSRLSAEEVKQALAEYPYRPVNPAVSLEELLDVIEVRDASPRCWSVNLPLWTNEEGRSDLVLQMHFKESESAHYSVEIDDIHVL